MRAWEHELTQAGQQAQQAVASAIQSESTNNVVMLLFIDQIVTNTAAPDPRIDLDVPHSVVHSSIAPERDCSKKWTRK
jgi:hypothetical protein